MKDDKYMPILSGYTKSIFQDFESYLRTEVDLVEDDIRLVLDEYNSSLISYILSPGTYTFKHISEALLRFLQSEYKGYHNAIDIEFDDITMKTKFTVRPGIIAIRFDEKSFFSTILGFNHGWVYKHYKKYTSQETVNLSITKKIHLKCDVTDGSLVNGLRQPILYSFVLDKKVASKFFATLKLFIIEKVNKNVLPTISFYLEDDIHKEADFNGETLTFTIQMIKI